MENQKIIELEEKIKMLEKKLNEITITINEVDEAKEIIINGMIGEVHVGNNQGKMNFQNCSIGSVLDGDIDEAEGRLDELESRLDEINDGIDDAESNLEELEDRHTK